MFGVFFVFRCVLLFVGFVFRDRVAFCLISRIRLAAPSPKPSARRRGYCLFSLFVLILFFGGTQNSPFHRYLMGNHDDSSKFLHNAAEEETT